MIRAPSPPFIEKYKYIETFQRNRRSPSSVGKRDPIQEDGRWRVCSVSSPLLIREIFRLKPVFDDDDEESAMNEASLASTSSFEEFDREHGELFDEMIRPGEDPRMARIRFMAKMRARKFRAK